MQPHALASGRYGPYVQLEPELAFVVASDDAVVLAWQRWGSLRDPDRFDAWFDQLYLDDGSHIFSDGFESGDTSAWSAAQGE